MKIMIAYVIMTVVLYHNWTDMGPDNERMALQKVHNLQGILVKAKE